MYVKILFLKIWKEGRRCDKVLPGHSITHSDGIGLKTDKSKLLGKLEKLQDGFSEALLPSIDVILFYDGLLINDDSIAFLCLGHGE